MFTMPCEATGGGLHAVNHRHLHLSQGTGRSLRLDEECIIPIDDARSQEGWPGAPAPPANNSGSANGSILSLVNRAVKSNIFMRVCQHPLSMRTWLKWTGPTVFCAICREFETKWINKSSGIGCCKYCQVEQRGLKEPVPEYMKELIPLD